ncbi:hypothetical protein EVA_11018 [gut metagenome]|uniref:Uncharacterized protein n=1 Tax=gut metagenome TaxID=749906 RepID=J9GM37_9ZZZZ
MNKNTWKQDDVRKACINIRQYQNKLRYSEQWMTDYVYNIIILAKKEPQNKEADNNK